jgi:RND family efflux transporter MFP subunit
MSDSKGSGRNGGFNGRHAATDSRQSQLNVPPDPTTLVLTADAAQAGKLGRHGATADADSAQAASELQAFKALETRSSRKRKSKRRRTIIIVAAILIAVTAAYFGINSLLAPKATEVAQATATVTRGNFVDVIESSGAISPAEQMTINPEIDGTVGELNVEEGSEVQKGDLLFTIENSDLDRQVESAQRGVDNAWISYNSAISAKDTAQQQASSAYDTWVAAKAAAGESVDNSGGSGIGLGSVEGSDSGGDGDGSSDGGSNPESWPTDGSGLHTESNLEPLAASHLEPLTTPGLQPLAASVDPAAQQQAIDAAWEQYLAAKSQVTSAQAQIDSAWLQVEEAESNLEAAKEQADKRQVHAPISGQVVVLNIERGTKLSSLAQSGQAPLQIADMSAMAVEVNINEIDILKIAVGQEATLTFDAIDGYTARAKVSRIASTSTGDASSALGASSGIVTYPVKLLIEEPDPRLRIGMSASADITVGNMDNVLMVNSMAVYEMADGNGKYVLRIGADGSTEQIAVKVLGGNDSTTVIEGAVKAGDEVVLGATAEEQGAQTQMSVTVG